MNQPGLVVPQVVEQHAELVVAAEDALRQVLELAVVGEAGDNLVGVARVQAPGVVGEQLLDLQADSTGILGRGMALLAFLGQAEDVLGDGLVELLLLRDGQRQVILPARASSTWYSYG